MDRADQPPLSSLSGQLKLGLQEEDKKEALWEDLMAFGRGLLFYLYRRISGLLGIFARFALSGFTLTDQFKFWLSRKFVRRKGQLSFPFAHVTLIGVSLSLLVVTASLGDFIFEDSNVDETQSNPFILESTPELVTEESELLRNEAIEYAVQKGEDIHDIASQFGISPDALAFANKLPFPYAVQAGQTIVIPPYQGIFHQVSQTTTVEELAESYGANPQAIIDINYLFPSDDGVYRVKAGRIVTIPSYKSGLLGSVVSPKGECGDLALTWPVVGSVPTQYWSSWHRAIDIPSSLGTPSIAVYAGEVVGVGSPSSWNQGYGGSVFINIGGGYQIRYAHMASTSVGLGKQVSAGDVIGNIGSTGQAFGTHLHLELLCNGEKIDPMYYFNLSQ
ncbi:MAG TPA: M23 family metallopeptidase [candidate division WWE3 bacterium]|uniref:M23 family metallopeptidase n=1 Tax=candidate division WWE3 bacterium TaxID=2053526 RepID=A0A7C1NQG6_UNCKA|nr:M23 family metallopeptidase [candidate division WWE3 bacterium]